MAAAATKEESRRSVGRPRTSVDRIGRYISSMITRLDLVGIPSQDADRARSFYRDTLGLRPDEHADYEQWAGNTCLGIWEPEKVGMPFVAQKGNPLALGCDDVAATRAELEAKGVEFAGDTLDTGVCHMAFFLDPDGNHLMLHHRERPTTDHQAFWLRGRSRTQRPVASRRSPRSPMRSSCTSDLILHPHRRD